VTTDRRGRAGYEGGDYTYGFGGTSSSTPLCAGLAGLILSVEPDLTSFKVRKILRDSADQIDKKNGAYDSKGHSKKFGYGRINARAALDMAVGTDKTSLASKTLSMEHLVKIPIPDLGEATDFISVALEEKILEIEISLDIRHTWMGDLSIVLQPPGQNEMVLQNRTGGGADFIVKTYRSSDQPSLFQHLISRPAVGDWKIKVADHARNDQGILQKWGISITY
jgi:subtilisin-like proprotein convertase family protein